jgi:DNA-binding Xre family transcriptional regulator
MTSESKRLLRTNVRALLVKLGGDLRSNESGVTRLVNLGIANGTAQRILDETTDVRLGTLDELAEKFNVRPEDLISPARAEPSTMPFRDLDPFEAQLVTLFRSLADDDERHHVLVELNQRTASAPAPSVANPWASKERRIEDVGHVPNRRATRVFRR